MRFQLPDLATPLPTTLRRAGYVPWTEGAGEASFIRRVGTGPYPRFHLYARPNRDGVLDLNLHLDQKRPSYAGSHAHSGEYEGPILDAEVARIRAALG